jgi:hypothetical protein
MGHAELIILGVVWDERRQILVVEMANREPLILGSTTRQKSI